MIRNPLEMTAEELNEAIADAEKTLLVLTQAADARNKIEFEGLLKKYPLRFSEVKKVCVGQKVTFEVEAFVGEDDLFLCDDGFIRKNVSFVAKGGTSSQNRAFGELLKDTWRWADDKTFFALFPKTKVIIKKFDKMIDAIHDHLRVAAVKVRIYNFVLEAFK